MFIEQQNNVPDLKDVYAILIKTRACSLSHQTPDTVDCAMLSMDIYMERAKRESCKNEWLISTTKKQFPLTWKSNTHILHVYFCFQYSCG